MRYRIDILKLYILVLAAILGSVGGVQAQQSNAQARADQISEEVAQLRGLPFRQPITVKNQSIEGFSRYLDAELKKQLPQKRARYFGKIVQKLGLYRGPEIKDIAEMIKTVMTSQTGAYYDPATKTFYVLMSQNNAMELGTIFSHELYHGLQDQYWDLDAYLLSQAAGALNDDQLMARQAVVEGEATYLMTLWTMQDMLGFTPDHSMIAMALKLQAQMDVEMLQEMMMSQAVADSVSEDVRKAILKMKEFPAFMIESLLGVYMKGAAFIAEVITQGGSWEKVEELFTNPPSSTEQILYPEKWLAGENPYTLSWPDFESEAALVDWEEIDSNVIGEIQWRIIFAEHQMKARGITASAGWDGDSYTVFKHRETDDWLLFVYTCWDSPKDAAEFAEAYKALLKIKYQTENEPTKLVVEGSDVFIVEGGTVGSLVPMLSVLKKTSKTK